MARGIFRKKELKPHEQFAAVDDIKMQLTLAALADKYNEAIRLRIYYTYQDPHLASLYRGMRNSGIYEKGSKDKSIRKEVLFPNDEVYDYCDTVLSALYGPRWSQNRKALHHELVKPWWVVEKI